jgi:uncharacterized protein YeaC (DUF1315 family)
MTDVFPGAVLRQLEEWGYPKGSPRPTPPAGKAFSVVHITGNSALPSADAELSWRINDKGLQNSATFFVNRDGSIRQALGEPLHMDPWANGDVNQPDRSNPRIAALATDGVNANQRTICAIENVGFEPGSPLTRAQEDACARIIAYYHRKAGVECNRRTIIGHYQLNSVSRANCPGRDKDVVDRIAALAAKYSEGGGATAGEDPEVIAELREQLANTRKMLESCRARSTAQRRALEEARDALAPLEAELAERDADLASSERRRAILRSRIATIKAKIAVAAADIADD